MEPEAQTGTQTEAHGGGSHIFPPFDPSTFPSQLLWLAISFGLLYTLMAKLVLPRLTAIFTERRTCIASDLDLASAMKAETEAALATYEKALKDARERAGLIAQEMRDKIKAEMDAERSKVEAGLAAKIAEAEGQIAASRDKAMGQVEAIASEVAEAVVEQLIGPGSDAAISGAVKTALKKTA